jgi:hypothetical protein
MASNNKPTQEINHDVTSEAESGLVEINSLNRNLLFYEIYNNRILTNPAHQSSYFKMIKNRLQNKYPESSNKHNSGSYEREVADRLDLLRAMSYFWKTPSSVSNVNRDEIKKFFHDIAKNKDENILVRRQAYKNWLIFNERLTGYEKTRLAANKESRLLHLVSFSDDQLIESLTESSE